MYSCLLQLTNGKKPENLNRGWVKGKNITLVSLDLKFDKKGRLKVLHDVTTSFFGAFTVRLTEGVENKQG